MLKLLCFGMMAIYVVWLATQRVQALSSTAGSGGTDLQKEVAGRLVVLGVCLAILLANPLGSPNADLLADSAVAAARIAPPQAPRLDTLAALGIRQQGEILAAGTTSRDNVTRRQLTEISDGLAAANQRLLDLDAAVRALQANPNLTGTAASADIARLGLVVDSLKQRALLLVVGATGAIYTIRGTNFSARDTTAGLHWVYPGSYSVIDPTGNATAVVIPRGGNGVLVRFFGR